MKYLNLRQLSEKLGNRSRASIYRDIAAKTLPEPIKLGGKLYWNEEKIDTALGNLGRLEAD